MEFLPENWRTFLAGYADFPALENILHRLEAARRSSTVYPPDGAVFRAFELTPPESIRVIVIGQDPYHQAGEAHGLAFSVPAGIRVPPSLRNIRAEYERDLQCRFGDDGDLSCWARGGVFLLNAVLSVRDSSPGSHRRFGWEKFTDAVVRALAEKREKLVFLLWGNYAISKRSLIPASCGHLIITSPHPSPLSAHRGFLGSSPFSRAEEFLVPWRWPRKNPDEHSLFA